MMNMQDWMENLGANVKTSNFSQATAICSRMLNEVRKEEEHPSIIFPKWKQTMLEYTRKDFSGLLNMLSLREKEQSQVDFDSAKSDFNKLYANTVVYLLRHPEKSKEKGRLLETVGVKQAYEYAKLLINEIMFCPKDVNVIMYHSEVDRTKKFAEIVAYELNKLAVMQKREASYKMGGLDQRLAFRFSDAEIEFLKKPAQAKGITPYGWEHFQDWMANADNYASQFPELHHPQAIISELRDFVDKKSAGYPSSDQQWNIVLGFTHSWILDPLRVRHAGENVKGIIPSAGFVKIDGGEIFVDNAWYKW